MKIIVGFFVLVSAAQFSTAYAQQLNTGLIRIGGGGCPTGGSRVAPDSMELVAGFEAAALGTLSGGGRECLLDLSTDLASGSRAYGASEELRVGRDAESGRKLSP